MSEKQTYRIPVSNGILEHCQKIGASIWFFLWCVDKTTKEITDESGNRVGQLSMLGYIKATRTPNGHTLLVAKSKKWAAADRE